MIVFSLYTCTLLACFENTRAQEKCIGENGTVCCEGYKWNREKTTCVKCNIGYLGSECEMQCPYPSYGDACQKLCDCEEMKCHFINGCSVEETTTSTMIIRQFVTLVKERRDESTKTLLIGLFGINSIVVIAAAIYIIKCLLKKMRLQKSSQTTIVPRDVEETAYETEERNAVYQEVTDRQYTIPVVVEQIDEAGSEGAQLPKSQTEGKSVNSNESDGYLIPLEHFETP